MKDYYQILGVSKTASREEIRTAYRRLSIRFHPDTSGTNRFEHMFRDVNDAYETLGNNEKRRNYDLLLEAANAAKNAGPQQSRQKEQQHTGQKTPPPKPDPPKSTPPETGASSKIHEENKRNASIMLGVLAMLIGLIVLTVIVIAAKADSGNTTITPPVSKRVGPTTRAAQASGHSSPVNSYSGKSPANKINLPTLSDTIKSGDNAERRNELSETVSKEQTVNWILEKLSSYTQDTWVASYTTDTFFDFSFDDYYLVITYRQEHSANTTPTYTDGKVMIPIYDLNKVQDLATSINFTTESNTIMLFDDRYNNPNSKTVTNEFRLIFKLNAETNLADRLNKAFMHLKTFYQKPPDKEVF